MTTSRFYSKKLLQLFLNPPHAGSIPDPDGTGTAVNPACSDRATITIRIKDDRIVDARFQTQGCAAAIAAGAATAILARDKSLDEAAAITKEDVVDFLEGLPENKIGCSVIAHKALRQAINQVRSQKS